MAKKKTEADILVGGQAVLEGVMMRTPNAYAVAVRVPGGEIVTTGERVPRWTDRYPILKIPFVRGTAILVQSLVLGIRALNFSAEAAMIAEKDREQHKPEPDAKSAPAPETAAEGTGAPTSPPQAGKTKPKRSERVFMAVTMVFSLALAIGLFVYFPYWLSAIITGAAYGGGPAAAPSGQAADLVHQNWLFFNVVDGLIRLMVFLAYLLLISRMKDIHRVFQYHGAEHKVVHLWEAKGSLDVDSAKPFTTLHPRCGTSFLLFVMFIGIIVFTLFRFDNIWLKLLSRVFLLPLIAGISYELIRLSARFPKNFLCRSLMAPGLLMQRITTKPPSDDMLEVSLCALQNALAIEEKIKQENRLQDRAGGGSQEEDAPAQEPTLSACALES